MHHPTNIPNTSIKSNTESVSRDFKGIWIPREIWLADLGAQEKFLWAEIHSLYDREKGGCYASNDYLCQFLGVKERRLQELMATLKAKGLVEQVSFDGRVRVIRSVLPTEDLSISDGAGQRCRKVHPRHPEKCTPPYPPTDYIDTSLDPSYTSLKVSPQECADKSGNAAKAAEKPKKKFSGNFTEEVKEVGDEMIDAIVQAKPDFAVPQNRAPLYTHVDLLLRIDKRSGARILAVLRWALADHFWHSKMLKANVAEYLRKGNRFDQLEASMKSETNDPKKVDRRTRNKDGTAVDTPWLEDLF